MFDKSLPEYSTVWTMGGAGDVFAPKVIAEIGAVRRLHSAMAHKVTICSSNVLI